VATTTTAEVNPFAAFFAAADPLTTEASTYPSTSAEPIAPPSTLSPTEMTYLTAAPVEPSTYAVAQAQPSGIAVPLDVPVQLDIDGGTNGDGEAFRFSIKPLNPSNPFFEGYLGGIKVITLGDGGQAVPGTILFTEPGIFSYEIRQMDDYNIGYTRDDSVYTLTVVIEDAGGALRHASSTVERNGSGVGSSVAAFTISRDQQTIESLLKASQ
jgi:hypothetical protein